MSDEREEAILLLRGGIAFRLVLNKGEGWWRKTVWYVGLDAIASSLMIY